MAWGPWKAKEVPLWCRCASSSPVLPFLEYSVSTWTSENGILEAVLTDALQEAFLGHLAARTARACPLRLNPEAASKCSRSN